MSPRTRWTVILCGLALAWVFTGNARCEDRSSGQTVYVPSYPFVKIGERGNLYGLAETLVIRNTDPGLPIKVESVDYYDSQGKPARSHREAAVELAPLASVHIFTPPSDFTGGAAPSWIVKWTAKQEVENPIVEVVVIGDRGGQGISFVSRGKPVKGTPAPPPNRGPK